MIVTTTFWTQDISDEANTSCSRKQLAVCIENAFGGDVVDLRLHAAIGASLSSRFGGRHHRNYILGWQR